MKASILFSSALVVAAAGLQLAFGAAAPAASTVPAAVPTRRPIEHRLAVGERISINFDRVPELNVINTLGARGEIKLGWINEPLVLQGLTIREAEEKISQTYDDARMLRRNVQVRITVEQKLPRFVNIPENVKIPGKVTMNPDYEMDLVDVIVQAGGFDTLARQTDVRVIRIHPDGTIERMGPYNVEAMMEGRGRQSAPVIEPNDTILIETRWL